MSVLHPYPRGWYRFRYSHEIARGRVVSARFFGKPLVGLRTESGRACVLDAHCAHLGAHLGGGRVLGERIQCPFHGWLYEGDGRCSHVPFADRIPDGARVGSYPVRECNGTIYFWHDLAGAAPDFEVPELPETTSAAWRRGPEHRRMIRSNIQEPRENAVDVAHGPVLHAKTFPPYPGTKGEVVGWREDARTRSLAFELENTFLKRGNPFRASLSFSLSGPGHLVMRTNLPSDVIFLVPVTPVDGEHIVFTMLTYVRRSRVPLVDRLRVWLALRHLVSGLYEDYAIFEQKRYLREPLISSADGPILAMRRWFGQFYPDSDAQPGPSPARPEHAARSSALEESRSERRTAERDR